MMQPVSYGPDKKLVAFWSLMGLPVVVVLGLSVHRAPSLGAWAMFVLFLCMSLAPIAFASRFRAIFAPTEFVYRRWGPTVRVPYLEIDSIEVTNVTPLAREPIGAFIVTKGGQRFPFWPKLFPREAVARFLALAP